jgi:hypothetical protein
MVLCFIANVALLSSDFIHQILLGQMKNHMEKKEFQA